MSTWVREHLRSNVIGYAALFLALSGGVAWANHPGGADTISSGDIINNEVKSVDLANGEVKTDDLGANSVGSGKIADQSVKNADLSIGASSSNTIADGGIQGVDVKHNTLTGTQVDESTLFNDNSLTGADIDESTLAGVPSAPTGPAGGDLDGTYPDPVIAEAAVTIPKLAFDPATQAELDDHAASGAHDNRYWKLGGNSGASPGVLGTLDNEPLDLWVNDVRALRLEPASNGTVQSPNVIGGAADNSVTSGVHSATIAGGGRSAAGNPSTANTVTDDFGTIGGGGANRAGDGTGTVSDQRWATVGGGRENTASGSVATVGGGDQNTASAFYATVPGGLQNTAQGPYSLAAGRRAQANHQGAFVWGDSSAFDFASTAPNQFNVRSTGGTRLVSGIDGAGNPTSGLELLAGTSGWSTVANGEPFDIRVNNSRGLRIEPASDGTNQSPNMIGGIADNSVTPGVHSATIAGGGRGTAGTPASANEVTDNYGTIGGGSENQAGDAGGTVSDRQSATIAGGNSNTASGERSTVGGGVSNTASGRNATVGGGQTNTASGFSDTTVGGGSANTASGFAATVGGGFANAATGESATVSGGQSNIASGAEATVPGGLFNRAAGDTSFIAGNNALNLDDAHDGVFMFSDSQPFAFFSTAANEFAVRSTGGARFVSAIDAATGAPTAGVTLAPGSGSWSDLSDEDSKTAITPISVREVLDRVAELPVSTWSYKAQGADVRHIGPMAQDFAAAFEVGEDERHIATVDANGVALAAIKGLNEKVERLRRQLVSLRQREASR